MSNMFKILLGLCTASVLGACAAPQEDYVVVDPEPISVEPVYTGKYK